MHSCIDPPEQKTPGSWPGVKTEPSLNNSSLVPEWNLTQMVSGDATKVKPHLQQVVDKKGNATTGSLKSGGIGPDQQKLLNCLPPCNHHFGLLLALHDELKPEHCEEEIVYDDWEAEILRRVKMFS